MPSPAPVPSGPSVTLTEPTDGSAIRGALTLGATAEDASRVVFTVDGAVVREDASAPYGFRWVGFKKLALGPHTVEARAYDSAGRSTADAATVTRLR